jgi:hypothetical protein
MKIGSMLKIKMGRFLTENEYDTVLRRMRNMEYGNRIMEVSPLCRGRPGKTISLCNGTCFRD